MAILNVCGVKITGMAAAVPEQVVSNETYDWISEADRATLIATTGIKQRRFAQKGTCASDIGVFVSEKLIDRLGWDNDEIELVIFVSQSRDYLLPNTACIIQNRLGFSKKCMAFDVPLGCSGYVYGLSIVASLLSLGSIKKGLLIAGDTSSFSLSYQDKSTYPLFGDAVSATAFEYTGNTDDVMHFELFTDGSGFETIIVPDGGTRHNFSTNSLHDKTIDTGIIRNGTNLALDGIKIFEFTIREVAKSIENVLIRLGKSKDDYAYFVFHQANLIMNETIRKQLKLSPEKVPYTLAKYGNTSSASIPLTVVSEINNDANTKTNHYILAGFGVGLSWGVASVKLDNIICPEVFEYIVS